MYNIILFSKTTKIWILHVCSGPAEAVCKVHNLINTLLSSCIGAEDNVTRLYYYTLV